MAQTKKKGGTAKPKDKPELKLASITYAPIEYALEDGAYSDLKNGRVFKIGEDKVRVQGGCGESHDFVLSNLIELLQTLQGAAITKEEDIPDRY